MKKLLLLIVLSLLSLNMYAHDPAIVFMGHPLFKKVKTTPLQLTMWPVMLFSDSSEIYGFHLAASPLAYQSKLYGISAGVIMGSGKLYGVSVSGVSFGGDNYGCSIALYNHWEGFSAISVGLANCNLSRAHNNRNLLQFGVFNYAENGLQIGLLNYNPNALIPWMPLINWVIPRSVESSLKELRKEPYPFDDHIAEHANQYFPKWNQQQRLHWLNELFPLTDAGATYALMEAAKKT